MLDCSLDPDGLAAQRSRYATLARTVDATHRTESELLVDFAPGVDRALLDQTLAVERECCPFFTIALTGDRLTVGVEKPEQRPALDAIAHVLGSG